MTRRCSSTLVMNWVLLPRDGFSRTLSRLRPANRLVRSGDHYVAVVKPGRIMFELGGVRPEIAQEALSLAAQKMPIKCKIIGREDVEAAE